MKRSVRKESKEYERENPIPKSDNSCCPQTNAGSVAPPAPSTENQREDFPNSTHTARATQAALRKDTVMGSRPTSWMSVAAEIERLTLEPCV